MNRKTELPRLDDSLPQKASEKWELSGQRAKSLTRRISV